MTQDEPVAEFGLLAALVLGIVEGLTEFLPVSSTGHLIVAGRLLGHESSTIEVAVQAGAISAILLLYLGPLWRAARSLTGGATPHGTTGNNLLLQIVIGALPAIVLGYLLHDWIDAHLFSPWVVAWTMLIGGVLLLWLERWRRHRAHPGQDLAAIGYRRILCVGCWQCLALVPGTSRSGATIAGGLLLGMNRTAAAEYSFLVGLPILYGACTLKLIVDFDRLTGPLWWPFVVGSAAAAVSALLVVRLFVRFLQRHGFGVFAWYRIVAGVLLLVLCWRGWL